MRLTIGNHPNATTHLGELSLPHRQACRHLLSPTFLADGQLYDHETQKKPRLFLAEMNTAEHRNVLIG